MVSLFAPLRLRSLSLPNRIAVSPMCQYSAIEGVAQPWHHQHVGHLVLGGTGLVVLEATAVLEDARITHSCLGLYSDACETALAALLNAVRSFSATPIGIQLSHAGRKASAMCPWEGGGPIKDPAKRWRTFAPSPLPHLDGWPIPEELTLSDITTIVEAFARAATRADRAGFDLIEIHGAHGYLIHQFQSPFANRRSDSYGGNVSHRMRFGVEVSEAIRAAWPAGKPLGVRITGTEWLEGGLTVDDAVAFAAALKAVGVDYVCVSSAGTGRPHIPVAPSYQVALAREVRERAGITTQAVGLIVKPRQADEIVRNGEADFVALARGFLDDPRWGWHAGAALGRQVDYPVQYERADPARWSGYALAHADDSGAASVP